MGYEHGKRINSAGTSVYPAAALGRGAMDLLIAQCDLNERGRPAWPYRTAYRAHFRPGPSCPGLP